MTIRIIPRLDVKGPNLVKGIHLEGLRALGPPEEFARLYYAQGADELLYIDAVASLYGRNSLVEMIRRTAAEIFVPLAVGGGLRSLDDISEVLAAGADKVAINTAAILRPDLVREAARRFGSSTIVVSLQVSRRSDGSWECFTDSGREATGRDAIEWALEAEKLGAGEVLITSIDRDGTGEGFDLEFIKKIAKHLSIPVIAGGGAGDPAHVERVIVDAGADAVCVASLLHYEVLRTTQVRAPSEVGIGHLAEATRRQVPASGISLSALKQFLFEHGHDVRPTE